MKLKFDRSARIKILLIVAVVLMAPWFAPFAIDFIILADFMGLEALLVFLFASSRSGMTVLRGHLAELKSSVAATFSLVVALPLFTPRVYVTHATASTLLAVFACSVVLACAVWVPAMMMSMRYLS
jgi:undecaprenyl pyrophosphate phosphatase UppP